jgi:6-phosphofructokinase 1
MDLGKIAKVLESFAIDTLVMMGGWDGYVCMLHLRSKASEYPIFGQVNIMLIPCTISSNLPGTQVCIGTDTALNCIVEAVDKIKQSAIAHKRIFLIEVMGSYCGFLATFGAFATGAEKVYIHEISPRLELIQADMADIREGGPPTPMDRILAVEMAYESINRIHTYATSEQTGKFEAVALKDGHVKFFSPEEFEPQMDKKYRRPKNQWWFPK